MAPAPELTRRGALLGLAALAGCRTENAPATATASTPQLGPNGTGYLSLQAPLVNQTRDFFITNTNRLLDVGATEIYVPITSPGGVADAAQDIIAFIEQLQGSGRARFVMHNIGVVASAACYVFLAAGRRLSVPRGAFLFHEASLVTNGPITSQNLQEASARIQQIERNFTRMLTTRTRLTEAEATSFTRRTVILSADEARRDGIIEATAPFNLPPGATVSTIRAAQPNTPQPQRQDTNR